MRTTLISATNPFAALRSRWRGTPGYVRLSLIAVSVLTFSLLFVAGENYRLRQENARSLRDIEGLAIRAGALERENTALKAGAEPTDAPLSPFGVERYRRLTRLPWDDSLKGQNDILRAENAALKTRLHEYEIRDEQRQHPPVSQPPLPGMR